MQVHTVCPSVAEVPAKSERVSVSAAVFCARTTTWETLVREECHLCWHPQFVDHAIDHVPSASSIGEILASKVFLEECRLFMDGSKIRLSPSENLAAKLLSVRYDPQQEFLSTFIAQQTSRAVKALNVNNTSASALEEIGGALRYQYVLNAAKYRPGTPLPDGTFRTFGYSAFQVNFIREGWNLIKNQLRSSASIQVNPAFNLECDFASMDEAQTIAPEGHPSFRITLIETLREALAKPLAWDVFNGLMFEDLTLEELAREVGISAAYISMTVSPGIVSSVQAAFDMPAASKRNSNRIKITDMREPLCRLLSKG